MLKQGLAEPTRNLERNNVTNLVMVIRLSVETVPCEFVTFQGKHTMATFPYVVRDGMPLWWRYGCLLPKKGVGQETKIKSSESTAFPLHWTHFSVVICILDEGGTLEGAHLLKNTMHLICMGHNYRHPWWAWFTRPTVVCSEWICLYKRRITVEKGCEILPCIPASDLEGKVREREDEMELLDCSFLQLTKWKGKNTK